MPRLAGDVPEVTVSPQTTAPDQRSWWQRFTDFMGPNNPDVQRGVERLREAQDQARQIPTGPAPTTIPGTAPGMGGRTTPAPATETPPAPPATLPPLPTLAELMEIGRRSGSTVVSGGEGQTPAPAAGPPGTSGQSAAPPAGAGGGGGTGPAAAGSGAGPAVAGGGGGGAADVPSPDYARVLALMEQMANPQRPDRDAGSGGWSRGWQEFLAGLGAGGGSLGPGSTVASVLGAGGRGSAEYRVTRGREEREAERAYEQARQEGQGRAAQLGLTMMGQQQQAALSRAELAQRRDEMMQRGQLAGAEMSQRDRLAIAEQGHRERISAAERLSREQIESSRLASQERSQTQQLALGLYQQQVRNIVAQAQIEAARARQSGTGQPFGTAGQQMVAHGLVGRFLLRAEEQARAQYGADWNLMRVTAQGQNILRDIASHLLMTTEEGVAAMRQWRGALTSRMPTGSTALTGTED